MTPLNDRSNSASSARATNQRLQMRNEVFFSFLIESWVLLLYYHINSVTGHVCNVRVKVQQVTKGLEGRQNETGFAPCYAERKVESGPVLLKKRVYMFRPYSSSFVVNTHAGTFLSSTPANNVKVMRTGWSESSHVLTTLSLTAEQAGCHVTMQKPVIKDRVQGSPLAYWNHSKIPTKSGEKIL